MKKVKTFCRIVDWSGASVTPRGFSVTDETLQRTEVSEAAHRTPPGKDAGGTEINLSPCKVTFSVVDIIFFQQHESCHFVSKWQLFIYSTINALYI
ncbi:hypothetical protein [Lysinibacillus sp. AR18-8]|uniref:hypothetical protein n=1 Tax=Lysinibacillus sp. AR18-8 TaxID=1889781 RepID=UPI0020C7CDDE|nr:hypothetical protein [Lysinibacillus sp. AR18-8]